MSISFIKYRTILLLYLTEECVFKIEQYYISMFYNKILERIRIMDPSLYEGKRGEEYYLYKYGSVLPLVYLKKLFDL